MEVKTWRLGKTQACRGLQEKAFSVAATRMEEKELRTISQDKFL